MGLPEQLHCENPSCKTKYTQGMGNMFVFRNVGGKIEQIRTEGNYDDFVKGLKFVKCK